MKKTGDNRTILITGGAGFIGSNLAQHLLSQPASTVRIFDNLSRKGVENNLAWLQSLAPQGRLELVEGDVRDAAAVSSAAHDVSEIYHLAAQVAVTTSIESPRSDFEINALGTLNVLEAARKSGRRPFVLFTSTNKVYGALDSVPLRLEGTSYSAVDPDFNGVNEAGALDFHSPYGCSKGAADQYVRDYARIYDLPTVVFRMSCIAGPRQFGNEDQGWVAHFLYSVIEGCPISIYGDGFQVRDVLHVYDLLDAMEAARTRSGNNPGQIYNVGGGMKQAVSVMQMLAEIEREVGVQPLLHYSEKRPGDQPLYISDTNKLTRETGWKPQRSVEKTLQDIHAFWKEHKHLVHSPELSRNVLAMEMA